MAQRLRGMAKLTELVTESLMQTGVTWRDMAETEHGPAIVMPLPKFFTDVRLNGYSLQDYVEVKIDCGIEDFVVAYEQYVTAHILRPGRLIAPDKVIGPQLGISANDAKMLFGRIGTGAHAQRAIDRVALVHSFAALALYNFEAEKVVSHSGFYAMVQHGDVLYKFGSSGGAVYSNYGAGLIVTGARTFHPVSLDLSRRSKGSPLRKPCLVALLWAWLGKPDKAVNHPEKEALRLALVILFWKSSAKHYARLRTAVREAAGPDTWAKALALGKGYLEFEDPYPQLMAIFVPNLLTKQEFVKIFGAAPRRAGKPNNARKTLWSLAFQYLNNKYTGAKNA
jgi:hypothetical protein